MEIPLVVGKNKCVIVSSGPYTCVNHVPEMLWTRPHCEWHSHEPGEVTTPHPTPGQDSVQQALDPALPPPSMPTLTGHCESPLAHIPLPCQPQQWMKGDYAAGGVVWCRTRGKMPRVHPCHWAHTVPQSWSGSALAEPCSNTIVSLLPRWASSPASAYPK